MTREITNDFVSFTEFIKNYKLQEINNASAVKALKLMHRNFYSLMTFFCELEDKNAEWSLFAPINIAYLKESISDLGQCLFCWLHGAYKPSNLVLRSSIETFIRATAGQEDHRIMTEKNMYQIFNLAKDVPFFNRYICKKYFNQIHSEYKDLCKVVHTTDSLEMAHISAMKTFPVFEKNSAKKVTKHFICITSAILSILYLNFYKYICKMHHQNQLNFLSSIPKDAIKQIHGTG